MKIDKIIYRQTTDACSDPDIDQTIDVEFDDAGAGSFVRIVTEGWSIDSEDLPIFARHLRRIISRHNKNGL